MPRLRYQHTVAVVGAGPAGLEAARILSMRGAKVEVFEKAQRPGGALLWAAERYGASRFIQVIEHLLSSLAETGRATLHFGVEVDRSLLAAKHGYDAIIIATGADTLSTASIAAPPGRVMSARQALERGFRNRGLRFLVVDEDWIQSGLSVARTLMRAGNTVTVVTSREQVGAELNIVQRTTWIADLRANNVDMHWQLGIESLADNGDAIAVDLCSGAQKNLGNFDFIVMVSPPPPVRWWGLSDAQDTVPVHVIGDAAFPRGLEFAMLDAATLARRFPN